MAMNVKEKIAQIRDKVAAAKLAVKATAMAMLVSGAGAVSSCSENKSDADENGEKTERVEGEKTSVVFRTKFSSLRGDADNLILLENGDKLTQSLADCQAAHISPDDGAFLEPGDTVTYEGNDVKAVRYKGGNGKQVNFGKIGKIERDITD